MAQEDKPAFRHHQAIDIEVGAHFYECYLRVILGVSTTHFPLHRSGRERKTLLTRAQESNGLEVLKS